MSSELNRYNYTWRTFSVTIYAEDQNYADAIFARVLTKDETRPEVQYREAKQEYVYFQTKP